MLEVSPALEAEITGRAEASGLSTDEYLTMLLRTEPRQTPPASPDASPPADDPVLRFLNARLQEAETATPDETIEADAAYRRWQEAMNETRRQNGERLLFPEAGQP